MQARDFDSFENLQPVGAPYAREQAADSHPDPGQRQQTFHRITPDCVQRPAGRRFIKSNLRLLRSLAGVEWQPINGTRIRVNSSN